MPPELPSRFRHGRTAAAITQKESELAKTRVIEIETVDYIIQIGFQEGVGVKVQVGGSHMYKVEQNLMVQVGGSHMYKVERKRQRFKSTSSDESFKNVPQDLMLVIFSLLPLKCLLNSARYVSKSWATTIQSCLRCKPPGIYMENINSKASYFLNIQEGSQTEKIYLGIPPIKEKTFMTTCDGIWLGKTMATCDGILLLRDYLNLRLTFAVNPILKCFFRIPPLPTSNKRVIENRYTIENQSTITRVFSRCPYTTKFKLFFVDVLNASGVNCYVFYVLRIGIDNIWKEIARKEAIPRKRDLLWEPIFNGDNDIYWITANGVIVMDVDQETIIKEYPLPHLPVNVYSTRTFLWMGDRLSYINVVVKDMKNLTYQVYTLNLDLGSWTFYLEMGPFDFGACGNEYEFDNNLWSASVYFRFWMNDQIIFKAIFIPIRGQQFSGFKSGHFCYNVKTRQLTKIDGIASDQFSAWLHTNTLVSRCQLLQHS